MLRFKIFKIFRNDVFEDAPLPKASLPKASLPKGSTKPASPTPWCDNTFSHSSDSSSKRRRVSHTYAKSTPGAYPSSNLPSRGTTTVTTRPCPLSSLSSLSIPCSCFSYLVTSLLTEFSYSLSLGALRNPDNEPGTKVQSLLASFSPHLTSNRSVYILY